MASRMGFIESISSKKKWQKLEYCVSIWTGSCAQLLTGGRCQLWGNQKSKLAWTQSRSSSHDLLFCFSCSGQLKKQPCLQVIKTRCQIWDTIELHCGRADRQTGSPEVVQEVLADLKTNSQFCNKHHQKYQLSLLHHYKHQHIHQHQHK